MPPSPGLTFSPGAGAALAFSIVFALALLAAVATRLWLASRQARHVAHHRSQVPPQFAERIALAAHQRAADYTIARVKLGVVDALVGVLVVLGFTLLGGLQWLDEQLRTALPQAPFWRQVLLVGAVVAISGAIDLPLSAWRQFVLEKKFGFNRMTVGLFIADLVKGTLVGMALGLPLLAAVLWLMDQAGPLWWAWAWLLWMGFNLAVLLLFPTVIAPLFNKFKPLEPGPVRDQVEALLARCGFASRGVFVMDGSRRSAHGNAYFTGFGRGKRIVFFDTLLARLDGDEIEAVLAHELGHYRLRHIAKRIAVSFAMSLAGLALLGWLSTQGWFYQGLGVTPDPAEPAGGVALVLFFIAMPVFTFLLQPLSAHLSRRHEFEADAFAARHANAADLVRALVKLYEDNASTLTPDPVHSAFYDSHPPASVRIGRLAAL